MVKIKEDNQPLVSIVTPSYNQGQFIEDTILSVKNQDYPNIEHIIIDGESTDNTLEILKKYEGSYNMRWISEPDEGQADAVNKGFDMANGEIIGWLNSDDIYFSRDTISGVVKEFGKNIADIIFGDVAIINENNYLLKIQCFPEFNYKRMVRGDYIGQPATFFRQTVVKKHKLDKQLNYGMDYEYWLRLGKIFNFRHINQVIAGDRNHESRKILSMRHEMTDERIRIQKRYGQKFSLNYYLGRLNDKIFAGLVGRIRGLIILSNLKQTKKLNLKIKDKKNMILNQLWRKNKDIH